MSLGCQPDGSMLVRPLPFSYRGGPVHSEGSYEAVLSQVTDGLSWASGWQESVALPSKSAIFQARVRLGPEPLEELFARVAKPFGAPGMRGAWLAGRRLVAIDGSCLDVADTPVNGAYFGRALRSSLSQPGACLLYTSPSPRDS